MIGLGICCRSAQRHGKRKNKALQRSYPSSDKIWICANPTRVIENREVQELIAADFVTTVTLTTYDKEEVCLSIEHTTREAYCFSNSQDQKDMLLDTSIFLSRRFFRSDRRERELHRVDHCWVCGQVCCVFLQTVLML